MASQPERLLVVDDDGETRDMLSRRLSRRGYAVDVAEDGETALAKIAKAHYDLVLLNQVMPGMGGLDLLRLLRATYSRDDLPVIMMAEAEQAGTLVEALDGGANDYVVTPADLPVMTARIAAHLSRAKSDREGREGEQPGSRAADDAWWEWDLVQGTMEFSPRWLAILGYSEGELRQLPEEWLTRLHPDDEARVREELREFIKNPEAAEFISEQRVCAKHRDYQWVLARATLARGEDGRPLRLAGTLTDIAVRMGADPLTGLGNRLLTLSRIDSAIKAASAGAARSFALLFVDLDGFKIMNDSYGHHTGDRILCEAAARIRGVAAELGVGASATVSRVMGDEFTVFLDGMETPQQAQELAERFAKRVVERIAEPTRIHGFKLPVSASVGVAVGPSDTVDPEDVIGDAELATSQAKEMGKNRWAVFEPKLRHRMRTRMATVHDLRRAIENRQLEAYYQPKVILKTGEIIGFEALLRWRHPKRGLIQPDDFIPLAEETGLIVPIGEWILQEACCQLKSWQNMFPSAPALSMNVNLSVKQLADPHLVQQVRAVLDKTGVVPGSLKLELTESGMLTDIQDAKDVLERLQSMNVGLKLDDFGTGYSSLNHLRQLHFDSLKIDRSFVARMSEDEESHAIVETMIKLAKAMGMTVVAEGIEEAEQLNELIRLGCEIGQGFYFSKPVEAAKAEKLLESAFGATV